MHRSSFRPSNDKTGSLQTASRPAAHSSMGSSGLSGGSPKVSLVDGCKAKYFLLVVCGLGALLIMHRWTFESPAAQNTLLGNGSNLQSVSSIDQGPSEAFRQGHENDLQEERGSLNGHEGPSRSQQSRQQDDEQQQQQSDEPQGKQQQQGGERSQDREPVPLPTPKQQVSFLNAQNYFNKSKEMLLSEPSVYGPVEKEGILNLDDWSMRHVPDRVEDFVSWRMARSKGIAPADESSYTCAAADHPPTSYPGCHVFVNEK